VETEGGFLRVNSRPKDFSLFRGGRWQSYNWTPVGDREGPHGDDASWPVTKGRYATMQITVSTLITASLSVSGKVTIIQRRLYDATIKSILEDPETHWLNTTLRVRTALTQTTSGSFIRAFHDYQSQLSRSSLSKTKRYMLSKLQDLFFFDFYDHQERKYTSMHSGLIICLFINNSTGKDVGVECRHVCGRPSTSQEPQEPTVNSA